MGAPRLRTRTDEGPNRTQSPSRKEHDDANSRSQNRDLHLCRPRKLTHRGLSGQALGAHIHIAKRGASHWEPVIGLCGFLADPGQPATCRSGVHGAATVHAGTLYRISASQVRRAILNGGAYVNIHTTRNYNWGETRGQIEVVK